MADGQGHSPSKIKRKQRVQELCESRGGRPVLLVLSKPDGFCGRKATLKQEEGGGAGLSQGVGLCFRFQQLLFGQS